MSYTKQEFVSGQILKAEHLNHMEDGIGQLSEEIKTLKGEQLIFDIQAITEATKPYYTGTALSDYVLKEGNICRVVHNETVYYCAVRQNADGIFIGNRYLKNINMEDTGESFYIDVLPNYGVGVFFFQEFGNNKISVSVLTHLPLPEIFVDTTNLVEEIANKGNPTDEQVDAAVNAYLDEHPVTPVEIDTTLTQEGKAADAKAVGDAVGRLSEDTSTVYISYNPSSLTYTCESTFEDLKEIDGSKLQVCYHDNQTLSTNVISVHFMRSIYIHYVPMDLNTGATYFEFAFLKHSLDGYIILRFNSDNTIVKIAG